MTFTDSKLLRSIPSAAQITSTALETSASSGRANPEFVMVSVVIAVSLWLPPAVSDAYVVLDLGETWIEGAELVPNALHC